MLKIHIVPTISVVHIQHTHAQTKKEKTRHVNDYITRLSGGIRENLLHAS
jgi:hypothetical protein